MEIIAHYDKVITTPIRNKDGAVDKFGISTVHYTFGNPHDLISGGFYIQKGSHLPDEIILKSDEQMISAKFPPVEIKIRTNDGGHK